MVVFGIGDGRLQDLLDVLGDALGRKAEFVQSTLHPLAADGLGHEIEFAGRDADVAANRHRLMVFEHARAGFLAHYALFAFLSPPEPPGAAEWLWKVRVGENSPSLWPTMSSVTSTGICLRPL